MLARGSLGNPWLFEQLLGLRADEPDRGRGPRRARLAHRPCRRAPGRRARRPLAAQGLPLVRQPRRASSEPSGAGDKAGSTGGPLAQRLTLQQPPEARSPWLAATTADAQPMPREVILTPEGLDKLKEELELLSGEKRREVAERIKEAREFGDISENSEYDDAKNEQAMLEARIAQLEEQLRAAQVIDAKDISHRRRQRRLDRPRQGREDRQVAEVHDRRLGRGQPGRAQALQRVTGRPGAARSQAQRDRLRARSPRARPASSRSPRSTSGSRRASRGGATGEPQRDGRATS